jgi:hypothetical protein
MSKVLRQRNLFVTKIFEITNKSLKVKTSNLLNSSEQEFSFRNITEDFIRIRYVSKYFLAVSFILAMLSVKEFIEINNSDKSVIVLDYLFIYLILLTVSIVIMLMKKTQITYLILSNKRKIKLYTDKPNKTDFDNFLETLHSEKIAYVSHNKQL